MSSLNYKGSLLIFAIAIIPMRTLPAGFPIIDAGNLQQRIFLYLEKIQQRAEEILYDGLIKEVKVGLANQLGIATTNNVVGEITARTEVKIQTTNQKLAARFDSYDNACSIADMNNEAIVATFLSNPLSDQTSESAIERVSTYSDKALDEDAEAAIHQTLLFAKSNMHRTTPPPFFYPKYVEGITKGLTFELINTIKKENASYQASITTIAGFYDEQVDSLAIDGSDTQLKRVRLIEKSMKTAVKLYQYKIKRNLNLLSAITIAHEMHTRLTNSGSSHENS